MITYKQTTNIAEIIAHLSNLSETDRTIRFNGHISLDIYRKNIQNTLDRNYLFVAEDEYQKCIGFAQVGIIDKETVEIGISVDTDYRKNGIGRNLIEYMKPILKSMGYNKIKTFCSISNAKMVALAKKLQMDIKCNPLDREYEATGVI